MVLSVGFRGTIVKAARKGVDRLDHFRFSLVLLVCLIWSGCLSTSLPNIRERSRVLSAPCNAIESYIDWEDRIETLRYLFQAFSAGCDDTVISYGTLAQEHYKYKTVRVLKETGNIFVPDGTFIEYVLESYERGFLNVLLAAGYYHQRDFDSAKVELRRLDHEIFTPLYNYGTDPVNLLFSAVFWELLGKMDEAWVDWSRLQDQDGHEEPVRQFAARRLAQLESLDGLTPRWQVYAIGNFPGVDWNIEFNDVSTGYFSVSARQPFLPGCHSNTGVRISTHSWFEKIAMRHDSGYHPLLHAQSWLRLPVGVVYGITTFTAGASIMVGGCYLDMAGKGDGSLCKLSINGGMALIRKSPEVLRYALQPDLRHWDNVPAGFLFTTSPELTNESCFKDLSPSDQDAIRPLSPGLQSQPYPAGDDSGSVKISGKNNQSAPTYLG